MKVWFIKNYMSPQMKHFLPHMAEHYGFDYEFVTYKWPSWLHKQVPPPFSTLQLFADFLMLRNPLCLGRLSQLVSSGIIKYQQGNWLGDHAL